MLWTPFKITAKKFVGIDIGTASVKIVELSHSGEKIKLENYGEMSLKPISETQTEMPEKSILLVSNQEIAECIQTILKAAKIETKEAFFSIPDFSSFFTSFRLPPMTKEEIPEAARFEARQHIPLPLSEVVLDWSVIENNASNNKKEGPKILLVAVPHEVINQYQEIAQMLKIKVLALEAEVFGLVRALIKEKKGVVAIIDIGAQTSTISIIENGILKTSHSFDVSGNEFTRVISKSMDIDYNEAERVKRRYGIKFLETKASRALLPLIDLILAELDKISRELYLTKGKEIDKVILCGGTALLPGLREYFADNLKKTVEIAHPLSDISYPSVLEETVKEMGPSYAVTVGITLRGFRS